MFTVGCSSSSHTTACALWLLLSLNFLLESRCATAHHYCPYKAQSHQPPPLVLTLSPLRCCEWAAPLGWVVAPQARWASEGSLWRALLSWWEGAELMISWYPGGNAQPPWWGGRLKLRGYVRREFDWWLGRYFSARSHHGTAYGAHERRLL